MADLEKLACGQCGASLSLPKGTRFVTCSFCNTTLRIKHEGGAIFTEIQEQVEGLGREVSALKAQNHLLKLRADLQELDRDWEGRRAQLMVRTRYGRLVVPKKVHAVFFACAFGLCAALILTGLSRATKNLDGTLLVFVILLVAIPAVLVTVVHWTKAVRYEAAYADYLARRAELDDAIAAAAKKAA